jgi:NADH-quinone oxidoreductase subunit L
MFMALGAGAFTTALFHVMTHAFFKACLFLGSGSVIHSMDHTHAVDDPQDIRTMGNLRKYMPQTSLTFWIATLAIAGIPGLSGFFSKDEILGKLFAAGMDPHHGNAIYFAVWGMGALTAFLTAFYMTRVTFLTFNGKQRFGPEVAHAHHHDTHHASAHHGHDAHGAHSYHEPHESPWTMTLPLLVLAFLSVTGGYLGLPEIIGHGAYSWIHGWLDGGPHPHEGAAYPVKLVHVEHLSMGIELALIALSILIAFAGMFTALSLYRKHDLAGDDKVKSFFGGLYPAMENKFYVDELYNAVIIRPFVYASQFFVVPFDKIVVDGAVNGSAGISDVLGAVFSRLQSGFAQNYALLMVVGVLATLAYLVF